MEGASNFRDLGGYQTTDGRSVKWHRLFRSNALAWLTESDLATVSDIGIRLICDFRSDDEFNNLRTRLPASSPPEILRLPIYPKAVHAMRKMVVEGDADLDKVIAGYVGVYRAYATEHGAEFSKFLHRLVDEENHAVLFHCSAGKDRTGFAAALILTALGVPLETVFADYLLTNELWKPLGFDPEGNSPFASIIEEMDEETRTAYLGARPEYLQAALDAINETHGSFDNFFRDHLGVNDDMRARLCELFLD